MREVVESEGLRRVSEVTALTRAGGGCFSCWPEIEAILNGSPGGVVPGDDPERREKFEKLVQALLEHELGPLLLQNGVRATLLDVEETRVLVQFEGTWEGAPPCSFEALRHYFSGQLSLVAGRNVELCEGDLGRDEETGLPTL